MARRGEAGLGKAGQVKAGRGRAGLGLARQVPAGQGKALFFRTIPITRKLTRLAASMAAMRFLERIEKCLRF